jgi:predicted nucleic acid-binding protein
MSIVFDTVALIHLAKLTILEKVCTIDAALIPELVRKEVLEGKNKGYPDVPITFDLIEKKKIIVKKAEPLKVKKLMQFNIQGGEAEAIALYQQEKAGWLVTDDDNVRKKAAILDIHVIGTPALIIQMYKKKLITKEKAIQSIRELQKIGWFSQAVIDQLHAEVETWEKQ